MLLILILIKIMINKVYYLFSFLPRSEFLDEGTKVTKSGVDGNFKLQLSSGEVLFVEIIYLCF